MQFKYNNVTQNNFSVALLYLQNKTTHISKQQTFASGETSDCNERGPSNDLKINSLPNRAHLTRIPVEQVFYYINQSNW